MSKLPEFIYVFQYLLLSESEVNVSFIIASSLLPLSYSYRLPVKLLPFNEVLTFPLSEAIAGMIE